MTELVSRRSSTSSEEKGDEEWTNALVNDWEDVEFSVDMELFQSEMRKELNSTKRQRSLTWYLDFIHSSLIEKQLFKISTNNLLLLKKISVVALRAIKASSKFLA